MIRRLLVFALVLTLCCGTTGGGAAFPFSFWKSSGGAPPFSPSDIAGLVLWCESDGSVYHTGTTQATNGQTVETWLDASVLANSPTQASGSLQPLFETAVFGSKPIVRFDGTNDTLVTPAAPITTSNIFTVVLVFATTASSGNGVVLDLRNSGGPTGPVFYRRGNVFSQYAYQPNVEVFGTAVINNGSAHLVVVTSDGTTVNNYVDGVLDASGSGFNEAFNSSNTARMGEAVDVGSLFAGDIAAELVYSTVANSTQLGQLHTYYSAKYGTP